MMLYHLTKISFLGNWSHAGFNLLKPACDKKCGRTFTIGIFSQSKRASRNISKGLLLQSKRSGQGFCKGISFNSKRVGRSLSKEISFKNKRVSRGFSKGLHLISKNPAWPFLKLYYFFKNIGLTFPKEKKKKGVSPLLKGIFKGRPTTGFTFGKGVKAHRFLLS